MMKQLQHLLPMNPLISLALGTNTQRFDRTCRVQGRDLGDGEAACVARAGDATKKKKKKKNLSAGPASRHRRKSNLELTRRERTLDRAA